MNENIKKGLSALELSEKQIKVYEALLSLGRGSAQGISHKAGTKRSTTYALLNELTTLGLVSLIPNSKKKLYRPLSPHFLVEKQKNKLRLAEKVIPEVEAELRELGMTEKPHVMFFEGVEGIKKIVGYKLEELQNSELREMLLTADTKTLELFGDFFHRYAEKLENLGIKERGISPDTPEVSEYNEKYCASEQDIKIVHKNQWNSRVAIEIGKTWVKMYDLQNLQGIIIQNPSISDSMRQMFDLAWSGVEGD